MPTEYFYNKEAQDIDEIKMEEGKLELREGERFVTCGSCMKHTRIVEKGSDEPFFEKCDNCAESVQKASKGCGILLFNHPEFAELKCKCGDSCGYYCDRCSSNLNNTSLESE